MIDIFSILKWIAILLLLWLLMMIYSIVIKPYIRCQYYVKQGALFTIFIPGIGAFGSQMKEVEKNGDFYHQVKNLTHNHKKAPRFTVDNIGVKAQVSLIEPKLLKEFYKKQDLYEKTKMFDSVKILFHDGILTSERETWKRQRKMASTAFHYESMKSMMPKFQEIAKLQFKKIKVGDKVNVLELFQQISGDVIGVMFFGYDTNSKTIWGKPLSIAMSEISNELSEAIKHPGVMIFGQKFFKSGLSKQHSQCLKKIEEYRSLVRGIIEDKRKNLGNDDDFLTRMLKTQELENENERFTTEEILDQFLSFFLAGMDTTSHLVDMAVYLSHAHPNIAKKLDEEREKYFDSLTIVDIEEVQKMDQLDCFLKECLRHYNPFPLIWSREALQDHNIGEIKIRKGDLVKGEVLANCFNAEYFEDPFEFKPERWADPKIKSLDPFSFIPFSSGPRNCIGQQMAMLEAKTIFSEFRRQFDFIIDPKYNLKMTWRLQYEPLDPVVAQITKVKV